VFLFFISAHRHLAAVTKSKQAHISYDKDDREEKTLHCLEAFSSFTTFVILLFIVTNI
jgi:hypothetical protein